MQEKIKSIEELHKFIFSKNISPSKLKALHKGYDAYRKYKNRKSIFLVRNGIIGSYVDDVITMQGVDDYNIYKDVSDFNIKMESKIEKTLEQIALRFFKTDRTFEDLREEILVESLNQKVNGRIKDQDKRWALFTPKSLVYTVMINALKGEKSLDIKMHMEALKCIDNIRNFEPYINMLKRAKNIEYQKKHYMDEFELGLPLKGMTDIEFDMEPEEIYSELRHVIIDLKITFDLNESVDAYYRMNYGLAEAAYRIMASKETPLHVDSYFLFYSTKGCMMIQITEERKRKNSLWLIDVVNKFIEFQKYGFDEIKIYRDKIVKI